MDIAWKPIMSTLENESHSNERSERADSRWYNATKYPLVRSADQNEEEIGIQTGDEQGYTDATRGKFNLGIEKTKQRNALRNEIYAQVLDAKMEMESADARWKTGLNQIVQVIDQLPPILIEGRIYVCEDGEIGIVWDDGKRRVEISAGVVSYVEYLIWEDEGNSSMECGWDIDGEQPLPDELKTALAKYQ